jgi:hypothetical protein
MLNRRIEKRDRWAQAIIKIARTQLAHVIATPAVEGGIGQRATVADTHRQAQRATIDARHRLRNQARLGVTQTQLTTIVMPPAPDLSARYGTRVRLVGGRYRDFSDLIQCHQGACLEWKRDPARHRHEQRDASQTGRR